LSERSILGPFDELSKESGAILPHQFRVKLYPEDTSVLRLEGLDDAIFATCSDPQVRCYINDRLNVVTVHPGPPGTKGGFEL